MPDNYFLVVGIYFLNMKGVLYCRYELFPVYILKDYLLVFFFFFNLSKIISNLFSNNLREISHIVGIIVMLL